MDANVLTPLLTALAVGVVMGTAKVVEYFMGKSKPAPTSPTWDETTGKVTMTTCERLRSTCMTTLERISSLTDEHGQELRLVRESVIRIEGTIGRLQPEMELAMRQTVDDSLHVHERRSHTQHSAPASGEQPAYVRRPTHPAHK